LQQRVVLAQDVLRVARIELRIADDGRALLVEAKVGVAGGIAGVEVRHARVVARRDAVQRLAHDLGLGEERERGGAEHHHLAGIDRRELGYRRNAP